MGSDKHERGHRERLPPFVPLLIATLESRAWRALSHGARSLYVALRRRYNPNSHNNGRIYLSHRMAREELRSGFAEIANWFRELDHYGLIRMTTPGHLGVEGKGVSPRWRLTELGHMKDPPTRDFDGWDGVQFQRRKTKPRYGKPERTATEIRSTTATEIHSTQDQKRYGNPQQAENGTATEIHSKSRLPSTKSDPYCSVTPATLAKRSQGAVASEQPILISSELDSKVRDRLGRRG